MLASGLQHTFPVVCTKLGQETGSTGWAAEVPGCQRHVEAYSSKLQQVAPMPKEMLGHSQVREGLGFFFTPKGMSGASESAR